ncbi:hypothetical protein BHM03_00001811 [Ensete ventricosum]|uniref:Uncharacterized protein n=1 Tax=Ensete ventricosum TaxID=4639 RepID=A0A445M9B6_ENSVE|nr:hypothetical protein BHM03_00001811 [Ensete ventricosum]
MLLSVGWARRRKIPKAFVVVFRLSSANRQKQVAHRAPQRADHPRPSNGPTSDSSQGTQTYIGPHGGSGHDEEEEEDPRILPVGPPGCLPRTLRWLDSHASGGAVPLVCRDTTLARIASTN